MSRGGLVVAALQGSEASCVLRAGQRTAETPRAQRRIPVSLQSLHLCGGPDAWPLHPRCVRLRCSRFRASLSMHGTCSGRQMPGPKPQVPPQSGPRMLCCARALNDNRALATRAPDLSVTLGTGPLLSARAAHLPVSRRFSPGSSARAWGALPRWPA